MAELDVTYHDRYREGKAHVEQFLFGIGNLKQGLVHQESGSSISTISPFRSP